MLAHLGRIGRFALPRLAGAPAALRVQVIVAEVESERHRPIWA